MGVWNCPECGDTLMRADVDELLEAAGQHLKLHQTAPAFLKGGSNARTA